MNLAAIVRDGARRHGARTALRLGDAVMTHAELDSASARAAGLLQAHGVRPGDRVGVMLPNVPHFALAYYGALRLGAIVVPMNVLLKRREVRLLLADSGAKVVLALEGLDEHAAAGAQDAGARCIAVPFEWALDAPALEAVEPRRGDETAVVLYTSGTTGTPKGAQLTNDNLRRNARICAGIFDLGPEDVALGALPLFHAFGQTCGLNVALTVGASLTLLPRFDPAQALDVLERHGVTICLGVPTMYSAMLAQPDVRERDLGRLRVCISGGSAMPVRVLRECEATFGAPLLEGYGLSETSPVASFNHPGRPSRPGSIGTPIEDVQMRVVDEDGRELPPGEVGEIAIRGHNLMKGYWGDPAATARAIPDGWLRTGDLGRTDEDGYFFIVDRKKDMIIRGGMNVYSREVEEVLCEHPHVADAALVPVPHPLLGEEVGAAVVPAPAAERDARAIRAFVRSEIAAYKYPRHIWFVDELPRNAAGKVLKRQIAVPEEVLAAAARRSGAK